MKKTLLFAALVLISSCAQRNQNKNSAENRTLEINVPNLPSMLTEDGEKANWLAVHFWDNFDYADTLYIDNGDVTEQAFANYAMIVSAATLQKAREGINKNLGNASHYPRMFEYFTELYEKYLYDPNSPYRNEEVFIPVLEHIVGSPNVDDIEKLRPRAQLEMALKNRPGQPASDITITLASGQTTTLYDVKAPYTLLFINNPDCHACAEVIASIIGSEDMLMPMIRTGQLKVVAVYPDEDLEAWHNHRKDIPLEWINGYDATQEMRDKRLYDLRAIPTLYLLDEDKKVLVKDAESIFPVMRYLSMYGY